MNKQVMSEKRVDGTTVVQKDICRLEEEGEEAGGGGGTREDLGKANKCEQRSELIITRVEPFFLAPAQVATVVAECEADDDDDAMARA